MKKTIAMLCTVLFAAVACADTWTDPETGIEWTYTVSDGRASVGSGDSEGARAVPTSTTGAITIPSTLGGCPVTSIGDYAFLECNGLVRVTIPLTVTHISDCGVFQNCGGLMAICVDEANANYKSSNGLLLSKDGTSLIYGVNGDVVIPNGVTSICDWSFDGYSNLTSVTIPKSVTQVGDDQAFFDCCNLTSFIVDEENPVYKSENGLLLSKDGTTICAGLNGDVIIPEGVTSIAEGTFYICRGLTSVSIPNSVTIIGRTAFWECSGLTNVVIGTGLAEIEEDAFSYCSSFMSFVVDDENTVYKSENGLLLSKDGTTIVLGVNGDVVIPEGVTRLVDWAFFDCIGLKSVTIPNSVTNIGGGAFYGCSGLTSVDFEGAPPSGLSSASIKTDAAIRYNVEYADQWLPVIQECGFTNATPYTPPKPDGGPYTEVVDGIEWTFMVSGGRASVGSGDSEGARAVPTTTTGAITIPSTLGGHSVTIIGGSAFRNCSGLTNVTIPNSVTSIGEMAFFGCSGLTSVTIPSSVTSIGERAFFGCSRLGDGVVIVDSCVLTVNGTCSTDVVLPEGTRLIAGGAFYGRSGFTSVTIPSSVTSIGESAFYHCSWLMSVTIQDGVTSIGGSAFASCSKLVSVKMPSSVTSIGSGAFWGCSALTSVTIPSSVTSIGDKAFFGCYGLTSVTIPSSVTSVGDCVFMYCSGLTSVTIQDGVTSIGGSAFSSCRGLTSVTIPSSVTSIGDLAFCDCTGLTSVTIPEGVTNIGLRAFLDCSGLKSVTIPSSVTSIGYEAFRGCCELTSADFEGAPPSGLSSAAIKTDAAIRYNVAYEDQWLPVIQECGFTNVTPYTPIEPKQDGGPYTEVVDGIEWTFMVTNGQSSVGSGNYYGAHAVPISTTGAIAIPSTLGGHSVTSIGDYAFDECTGLTSVTIPSSVTNIGYGAFRGCSGLMSFVVDAENMNYKSVNGLLLTKDGTMLIAGVNGDVTVPSSVTSIGDWAFCGCGGLTSVTIPSSVTSIGDGAFVDCSGLKKFVVDAKNVNYKSTDGLLLSKDGTTLIVGVNSDVTVPEGVTSIDRRAFEGCSGLTSVTIPNSVTSIGWWAFSGCSGLTSVTIPEGVTSIGYCVFHGCSGLTSVEIPSNVMCIDACAFDGCSGLTSVTIPSSVTRIDMCTFADCSALTSVTIPSGVTSIGTFAFEGCRGLTSVTIPSSVTSIGWGGFQHCSGLISVTIPSGVTSIGSFAFCGCTGLTSVTIPSSVRSIDGRAFYECDGLKTVYVDAGDKERVKKMIEDSGSGLSGVEYVVVGEYLVKFVAGEGGGTMVDMDCAPGKVYKLTKNAFTCEGKRFAGWRGSNGKRYDDEILVFDLGKAGEVLTLTAIWE